MDKPIDDPEAFLLENRSLLKRRQRRYGVYVRTVIGVQASTAALGYAAYSLAMAEGRFLGDRLFGYFGFLIGPQERTCLLDIDQGVRRRFFYALD